MSRHRAVKNLSLDDELDDGAMSDSGDEGDYDMDDVQRVQMASAVDAVHAKLGPATPIKDRDIKEALWNYYFDVDESIAYLKDEQKKKDKAADRPPSPPTTSLSTLSISSPPPPSTQSPVASAPPMSKLAARMAANKAAKLASSTATKSKDPPLAAPGGEEKKLSKLQLKMLASQAAKRGASSSPSAPPPASIPTPLPSPPPAPPLPSPPVTLIAAPPSHFASALSPPSASSRAEKLRRIEAALVTPSAIPSAFEGPSPDDKVLEARKGTALGAADAARAKKAKASLPPSAKNSRPSTPTPGSPVKLGGGSGPKASGAKKTLPAGSAVPLPGPVSQLRQDMEGMGLLASPGPGAKGAADVGVQDGPPEQAPVIKVAKEKILEEVRKQEANEKPALSLVVVGHVDAGKSTLMGRVLHELGVLSDKALQTNQRQAQKIGKGSFAYAWTFDSSEEERERGVTIDVAIDGFETSGKRFTLIDAPGHRDFIPNMISGAAQADVAVLVVDGSPNGFEKGFEGGGQTREHAVLVRSLGVQQLVVAVNKLDVVAWSQSRFENIRDLLTPFLSQSGFQPSKVFFLPVGATTGENLVERQNEILKAWWEGPTLVEQLDLLEVPPRSLDAPLRIPVSNVFKGQTATASGLAVSGRVESGIVQVGDHLAALPGDGVGIVRSLEVDGALVPWTTAGTNATLYLASIDPRQISVGCVLCPVEALVPVVSTFTAQIMVFELEFPITAGAAVELFHFSQDIPATITALEATLDKATGQVIKKNPRMLTKNSSARVQIQLRPSVVGGVRRSEIPLETFAANKSMGRVLFRRAGQTIAAGIVLSVA